MHFLNVVEKEYTHTAGSKQTSGWLRTFFNLQQLHSHSLSAAAALSGVSSEIVEHEAPDG
jgi:hypothetical protein